MPCEVAGGRFVVCCLIHIRYDMVDMIPVLPFLQLLFFRAV